MKNRIFFIYTLMLAFLIPNLALTQVTIQNNSGGSNKSNSFNAGNKKCDTNNIRSRSFSDSGDRSADDCLSSDINIPTPVGNSRSDTLLRVHMLGEVQLPGVILISPSTRLLEALNQVGGININGSERMVEIKRNDKVSKFDLFNYKKNADLKENPYLNENDVVFVPLKKGEMRIEGPIKRPGNYELTSKKISLKSAVHLAGGFTTGVSLGGEIKVIRFDKNGEKQIHSLVLENLQSIPKFDITYGDIVIVPHILLSDQEFDYNIKNIPGDNIFFPTVNDQVYVIGAVSSPGAYPYQPSLSYQDYVNYAGPTQLASIKRSKILKNDGKKVLAKRHKNVNAGDTIIVPSKSVTVRNALTWFNTLTSTTLTSILLYDRLENFNK